MQGAAPFVPSPMPTPACVGRYGASGLQPGVSSVAWREWLAQVGTALDPRQQNQASVGGRLLTSCAHLSERSSFLRLRLLTCKVLIPEGTYSLYH